MTGSDLQVEYRPFPKLTTQFVTEQLQVCWKDLAWAASSHWLDTKKLADLADGIAGASNDLRVALATAAADDDHDALSALLVQQATGDATADEVVRERWMRIAVAWLYRHRKLFDDPLAVIEEIWEAFGHSSALNGLVRWMPVPPGGKPGEQGILERWQEFVTSPRKPP